jgi:hypothetical protein
VVDFPAPFGPRNPVTIPERTLNERLSTAVFVAVPLGKAACLDH